jgi:hypothetical protein
MVIVKGVIKPEISKILILISHRPTRTHTDKFFYLDDVVQGKTVCPAGRQF